MTETDYTLAELAELAQRLIAETTQQQVAQRLRVSRPAVTGALAGQSGLLRVLLRIVEVYGGAEAEWAEDRPVPRYRVRGLPAEPSD